MQGIKAIPVQVEVDVSPGLPGFSMVGTVNSQVREAQDRVRTALHNLEIPVPPRRITINLSPADVPKTGTGFDLPITAAILESLGHLPKGGLEQVMLIGEVGLDGQIKKVRGVLAMVEEARKSGCQGCIVPWENRKEAQMIPGIRSVGVKNLKEFLRTARDRGWDQMGAGARIRSCYEYQPFLEQFLEDLPVLTRAYPEDASVVSPIETWSDDFSMAIAGIPSMVNDFTGGSFMETHYHSQFDNDEYYDPQVYQFHHELYALLILAIDATAVVPLSFTGVMKRAQEGLELVKSCENSCLEEKYETISKLLTEAEKQQEENYRWIMQKNSAYKACEDPEQRETLYQSLRQTETELLKHFKTEQDAFVRIDWYGNVFYPHEILLRNIHLLEGAKKNLEEGEFSVALRKLYDVDNNAYAFMFDKEVYRHFTGSTVSIIPACSAVSSDGARPGFS